MFKKLVLFNLLACYSFTFPKYTKKYVFNPSKYPDDNYFNSEPEPSEIKDVCVCELCGKCIIEKVEKDECYCEDEDDEIENYISPDI